MAPVFVQQNGLSRFPSDELSTQVFLGVKVMRGQDGKLIYFAAPERSLTTLNGVYRPEALHQKGSHLRPWRLGEVRVFAVNASFQRFCYIFSARQRWIQR
jgi:hypothetical protein